MVRKRSKFPTVPEVKLKRRKVIDQRNLTNQLNQGKKKIKHLDVFYHAEDFIKQSRAKSRALIYQKKIKKNFKSVIRKSKNTGKIFLVTLLQQIQIGLSLRIRGLIQNLRLQRPGQSVFIANTPGNRLLLKKIEPYVTYGSPSISTVRLLLEKRGLALVGDDEVPLLNNKMIEDHFVNVEKIEDGSIVCLEDLVFQIFTLGPHFDKVCSFLLPFQVSSSVHWKKSMKLFEKGGQRGDRGEKINEFVEKSLG